MPGATVTSTANPRVAALEPHVGDDCHFLCNDDPLRPPPVACGSRPLDHPGRRGGRRHHPHVPCVHRPLRVASQQDRRETERTAAILMGANPVAASIFPSFVVVTLGITYWANRRSAGTQDFDAAGGRITARQNGLAIAGDYLSAASFLGTISVFFSIGTDGLLYAVGAVAGWPIATFLIGERLRNLGRYTFSDALGFRLAERPVRALAAVSTLCISGCYLVAQLVGAGTLVQILFNIPYAHAVELVGALMMIYVTFGGMVATTWIQIVKEACCCSRRWPWSGWSLRISALTSTR